MLRARLLAVASGLVIAASVTAVALPALADDSTGTVTGHFTDGATPLSATVDVQGDSGSYFTQTDPNDGSFTITDVVPGTYTVSFQLPTQFIQYFHQELDPSRADPITVTAGQTTTVDETVAPHGGMSGHVTNADGSAAVGASVLAQNDTNVAEISTDANGDYSLPIVAPGDYRVSFQLDDNSPVQYANGKTNIEDADLIHVSVGLVTTLNQQLLATGTVSGTVTDHGQPVEGAFISARAADGLAGFGTTGPDGAFQLIVLPDTYTVSFLLPNGLTQYAHQRIDAAQADPITVTAGSNTVLTEQVAPTGVLSGHLLDHDGNPVASASVTASNDAQTVRAFTDDTGAYQMAAFTGSYQVRFDTPNGSDWAHDKSTAGQSDAITVSADATTTVDETLPATGSISLTAVDSMTNQPISSFCASVEGVAGQVCTSDGTAHFPAVLPGRYLVDNIEPDSGYLGGFARGVVVTSGADTAVTVRLDKQAFVSARLVDAKTGAPVPSACVELVNVNQPDFLGTGGETCDDDTGHVTMPFFGPGQYKAFVHTRDGVHGDQWVGPEGGVGAFKKAATVTVTAGATITLPDIQLDKAGTISGTITDAATGQPLLSATAALGSYDVRFAGNGYQVPTDKQGHYTLSGLGPYTWTLFFAGLGEADVFSGGVANRDKATEVKVKAGATTTFNVSLKHGVTVTGTVFGADGTTRSRSAHITFINADTDDVVGIADLVGPTFALTAQLAPSQKVKIEYTGSANGDNYSGWVGGTSLANATVFAIPASGSKTINVTMSQLDP
jgi:hypothetical protein